MFIKRISKIAVVIILTGVFSQLKAQDFIPGRLSSLRLSESFIRAESDFSRLTVFGYRYQFTAEIRVGADFGYHGYTSSSGRLHEFTGAGSTDFTYSHSRTVELYGTVSGGYGIRTDNLRQFIYQINPIGIRMGNGSLAGFAEAGWGYRGLLTIGIAYRI